MAQIGKIEHFQIGEDWESYEECIQQYFKANGITNEEKQVGVFLTVIGSHLYINYFTTCYLQASLQREHMNN